MLARHSRPVTWLVPLVLLPGLMAAPQSGAQARPRPGTPPPITGGQPVQQQTQQRTQQRGGPQDGKQVRWTVESRNRWRQAVQSVVRAERSHRWRMARLERIREVYAEQGRQERVRELEQLRERLQLRHQERLETCRAELGEGDYQELRQRIAQRERDRDRERSGLQEQDRLRDQDRTNQEG